MISRLFLAIAAVFLFSVCSCAHKSPAPPAVLPPVSNITASLTHPAQVKQLTNVPLTLSLKDSPTGKPVDGAKCTLNLAMPSMSMPMNMVLLTETQPGVYTGTGIFTMAGSWNVTVVALLPGGRELGKSFLVKVGAGSHSQTANSRPGS